MNGRSLSLAARRGAAALRAGMLERRITAAPPACAGRAELAVLFICHGNICRSPLAEGVLRARLRARGLAGRVHVDSAAIAADNVGRRADGRARVCAARHFGSIAGHRARQFQHQDFEDFDLIVAMDESNLAALVALAASDRDRDRVRLLLASAGGGDVSDPVLGTQATFERAYAEIDRGCELLAAELAAKVAGETAVKVAGETAVEVAGEDAVKVACDAAVKRAADAARTG